MKLLFSILAMTICSSCLSADISGALVLPLYIGKSGERKIFISEECAVGSPFEGTYEAWGGGFDSKKDKSELDTAAREFHEEALLQKTLGWTIEQTKTYLQSSAVETVVKTYGIPKFFPTDDGNKVSKPNFVYITQFERAIIKKIKKEFFAARDTYRLPNGKLPDWGESNFEFCEKGNLATISWQLFVSSIRNAAIDIQAKVCDAFSNQSLQHIRLRSILVGALHNHFVEHPQIVIDHKVHTYQCERIVIDSPMKALSHTVPN